MIPRMREITQRFRDNPYDDPPPFTTDLPYSIVPAYPAPATVWRLYGITGNIAHGPYRASPGSALRLEATAECHNPRHPAHHPTPALECNCGIYACADAYTLAGHHERLAKSFYGANLALARGTLQGPIFKARDTPGPGQDEFPAVRGHRFTVEAFYTTSNSAGLPAWFNVREATTHPTVPVHRVKGLHRIIQDTHPADPYLDRLQDALTANTTSTHQTRGAAQ